MEPSLSPKLAPYLPVQDARGLIRFLEEGLGGKVTFEQAGPDRRLVHAEVRVAGGLVMLADAPTGRSPFPAMSHLYAEDADAAYARAIKLGASSVQSPADSPDGNRRGGVRDSWGNEWWFSHVLKLR
ncbi:MAG: VOC family protein [Thermoplasmata archaeon]